MLRPLFLFQACFLMAASAQPIDARENLIYPTNPPKPASSKPSATLVQTALAQSPFIPAKSVFAVSKADLDETDPAAKELKLTILHSASEKPDPSAVRILAYFYEADGAGKVQLTESKTVSNWTSAPIDWSEDQAEELTLRYTAPPAGSGKKYVGYVVGIYYKDQLQDSSSSSRGLLEKFPLPTGEGKAGFASGSADASGRFLRAYKLFQAAENSFAEGDLVKAREAVQKSLAALNTLQKDNPDWQPRLVAYRIASAKLLEAKIDEK